MKAVILAGGFGTRIAEESGVRPKPMVEIGGMPIIWHIMKCYAGHGVTEFIVCCGYKGYVIKEWFANYCLHVCDVTFDLGRGSRRVHGSVAEAWTVTCVETGDATMTGGRLKRVRRLLGEDTFFMTYGDGLGDVDLTAALRFHKGHGKAATLTAVQPPGRFGVLSLEPGHDAIAQFREKPESEGWVNGGFFVLEPSVTDYVDGDETIWEREPLQRLAGEGELAAYRHLGYWQNMDTIRDRAALEEEWASGRARWQCW